MSIEDFGSTADAAAIGEVCQNAQLVEVTGMSTSVPCL